MKGPGHRYDIDIRRLWECPECGRQIRLPAEVAHRQCSCHDKKTWMRLVPKARIRTFPPRDKIVIPEDYAEPEEEISLPEDQPPTEASTSPDEASSTTPEIESILVETPEDSGSNDPTIAMPDSGQIESSPVDVDQLSEERVNVDPVETINSTTETANPPTDSQEHLPRKKRRRKRNRKRDRKKKSSDSAPQNSESNPSPPPNSPPTPSSNDFGSGV